MSECEVIEGLRRLELRLCRGFEVLSFFPRPSRNDMV